jgi:hypothetical protein
MGRPHRSTAVLTGRAPPGPVHSRSSERAQGQAVALRRAPFLPERRALRARHPVSQLAQAFIENG